MPHLCDEVRSRVVEVGINYEIFCMEDFFFFLNKECSREIKPSEITTDKRSSCRLFKIASNGMCNPRGFVD